MKSQSEQQSPQSTDTEPQERSKPSLISDKTAKPTIIEETPDIKPVLGRGFKVRYGLIGRILVFVGLCLLAHSLSKVAESISKLAEAMQEKALVDINRSTLGGSAEDEIDGYLRAVSFMTGVPPGVLKKVKETAEGTFGVDVNAAGQMFAQTASDTLGIDVNATGVEIAKQAAEKLGLDVNIDVNSAAAHIAKTAAEKVGSGAKTVGSYSLEYMKEQLNRYSNYFK